jgi:hypothetical protein
MCAAAHPGAAVLAARRREAATDYEAVAPASSDVEAYATVVAKVAEAEAAGSAVLAARRREAGSEAVGERKPCGRAARPRVVVGPLQRARAQRGRLRITVTT